MSLVISRKNGQTIMIGDNVTITVYSSTRTRVAIDAPKDHKVLRGELAGKPREKEGT